MNLTVYVTNGIAITKIIKIRFPPSRDTIIIPALVAASVTISITVYYSGLAIRSVISIDHIRTLAKYTARRIIYHLAKVGCVPFVATAAGHTRSRRRKLCISIIAPEREAINRRNRIVLPAR